MESTLPIVILTVGFWGCAAWSVLGVAGTIADVFIILATEVVGLLLADIGFVIRATDVAVVFAATFVSIVIISSSVEDSVGFAAGVEVVNPFFFSFATFFFTAAELGVRSIVTFRGGLVAVIKVSSIRVALAVAVIFIIFTTPVIAIDNFFVGVFHVFITNSVVV